MKLRVLGSYGGDFKGRFPAFLVNDSVLLDAGTIGTALTIEEQLYIRNILLTHHHIDHMLGIPFFADAVFSYHVNPVEIFALETVNKHLKNHILNDILWPDFTHLPDTERPTIRCNNIEMFREYTLPGKICFTPVPTCHSGPSCGYIIRQDDCCLVYSGDTGPCQPFWSALNNYRRQNPSISISALIIECSFPSRLNDFARETQHLTPELLKSEIAQLEQDNPSLLIFHMKPRHLTTIERELKAIFESRFEILAPDSVYEIQGDSFLRKT